MDDDVVHKVSLYGVVKAERGDAVVTWVERQAGFLAEHRAERVDERLPQIWPAAAGTGRDGDVHGYRTRWGDANARSS